MAASRDKKVKQTATLFIITFLISLIVFTYFIKSFSPNVDVEIGGEEQQSTLSDETDSDVKQAIDDRLRWIQMEDNLPGASKREDGSNVSEDIEYNDEHVKNNVQEKKQEEKKLKDKKVETTENIPVVKPNLQPPVPVAPVAEPPKMSKVYVGSYSTIEAAIQAQNKLMNTSVSVSPFVKEVNGTYVLQAGSYANASKAEAVSREISSLGFQTKVVRE